MKVFFADGYDRGHCRCGQCGPDFSESVVVVANTSSEALGMLLESYTQTKAEHWILNEIDCDKPGVTTT